MVAVNRAVR
jgi:hypothetical protein